MTGRQRTPGGSQREAARREWRKLTREHRQHYPWRVFYRDWQMARAARKHKDSIDV